MQAARRTMRRIGRGSILSAALALALCCLPAVPSGCGQKTKQAEWVKPSGFLVDYSQLKPGQREEQALLFYADPEVDFSAYDRAVVDPVTISPIKESYLSGMLRGDKQYLANSLQYQLRLGLSAVFKLVDRPGPGVLRVRAAITEARLSQMKLDGMAAIEVEIVDSLTNRRLAAAMDQRVGSGKPNRSGEPWPDAEESFRHWGALLRKRMQELRTGK